MQKQSRDSAFTRTFGWKNGRRSSKRAFRFVLAAAWLLSGCKQEPAPPDRQIPIGPGTRRSVLMPRDTPQSEPPYPASDTTPPRIGSPVKPH